MDMKFLDMEKIIQALGRIGRNSIQKKYTARFRDDNMISKLFKPDQDKIEARNMCRLFQY